MKRSLLSLSLLALVLFSVACATTTKPADVTGVITNISGNVITVTPRGGGETSDITVTRGTRILWQNGLDAGRSDLIVGHPVQVWLGEGSKTAVKINIAQ